MSTNSPTSTTSFSIAGSSDWQQRTDASGATFLYNTRTRAIRSLQAAPARPLTTSSSVQPTASFGSVTVIKKEIATILSNPALSTDAKTSQINYCLRDVFVSLLAPSRAPDASPSASQAPSLASIEAILLA